MTLLEGKRLIITGIADANSIAFAAAHRAQTLGAELILTAPPRDLERCQQAAEQLPDAAPILTLDATDPAHFEALIDDVRDRWETVDGALHAIAFAPRTALAGSFLDATAEAAGTAFATSAFSYAALARVVSETAPAHGASIIGLDFDAARAWPVYNWMGVCKAALESTNRYIARDLGPRNIRANLVAAGPLATRAANGIPDFKQLLDSWERAPMSWDHTDPWPVADAITFLFSDLSRGVTAEILHVDAGHHAVA